MLETNAKVHIEIFGAHGLIVYSKPPEILTFCSVCCDKPSSSVSVCFLFSIQPDYVCVCVCRICFCGGFEAVGV